LQRQRGRTLGDVFDLNIHVQPVLMKPAQVGLGGGPAITVFVQPRDSTVVNHFALLVAPAAVNYLALGDFVDVTRDDAIDELSGIAAAEHVLVEGSDVDQRGRIADGVVLVLMVHFVGANRVVSRPLSVVEALAERKSAFVKSSSDGHRILDNYRIWIIPAMLTRACYTDAA